MKRSTTTLLLLFIVVIFGCLPSSPPEESNIIQKLRLESIIRTTVWDGVDINPESVSSETKDREKNKGTTSEKEVVVSFRSDPEIVGDFATAIAESLQKEIVANTGSTDATHLKGHDWSSQPWIMKYRIGDAKGVARIAVQKTSAKDYPYELKIDVEETLPDF